MLTKCLNHQTKKAPIKLFLCLELFIFLFLLFQARALDHHGHHYRRNMVGSPPRGIPTMVDWLIEVRVIRKQMVTETQDLYRFRPLARRKILRPVFYYFVLIGYEIWWGIGPSTRRPLPLLIYSEETGLQVKYPIWYYTMSSTTCSSRCTLNSVVDRKSSFCGLGHLQ
jgi:hypothetical protein